MIERLRGARVREELLATPRAGDELGRRHHQRDRAPDLEVAGPIHVAERARAEPLEEVVVRNGLHLASLLLRP